MSKFIFFADHNEAALQGSFELAMLLKQEQHKVLYVGVSGSERLVTQAGLSFYPIYESNAESIGIPKSTANPLIDEQRMALLDLFLCDDELSILMDHSSPDLLFLPSYLALEGGLVALRYPILVSFLQSEVPAESRPEVVRRSCDEVLNSPIFGPRVWNYLSTRYTEKADVRNIVEAICRLPIYDLRPNPLGKLLYWDGSGQPFGERGNPTELLLHRHPAHGIGNLALLMG